MTVSFELLKRREKNRWIERIKGLVKTDVRVSNWKMKFKFIQIDFRKKKRKQNTSFNPAGEKTGF